MVCGCGGALGDRSGSVRSRNRDGGTLVYTLPTTTRRSSDEVVWEKVFIGSIEDSTGLVDDTNRGSRNIHMKN